MASPTQVYFNKLTPDKKSIISLIIDDCKSAGVTSQIAQSAILSITSKESDFNVHQGEVSYTNTSNSRIRQIFGWRVNGTKSPGVNYTDDQLTQLKSSDKDFFSAIYANQVGDGPPPTTDGFNYRGRGFNGLTFKDQYKGMGKKINQDLLNNPLLMEQDSIAAKALVQFFIDSIQSLRSNLNQFNTQPGTNGVETLNNLPDIATAVRVLYQANAGGGTKGNDGSLVALYFEKGVITGGNGDLVFPNDNLSGFTKARNRAPLFYQLITGGNLPPATIGTQSSVPPTSNSIPTINGGTQSGSNQPPQSDGRNTQTDDSNTKTDVTTPGLTNIFPPTLKVEPISFDMGDTSNDLKKETISNMGWMPFVWYGGYQIAEKDISFFSLYHDGMLPSVTLIFKDTMNLMKNKGFPLDDSKIKVFLSSRTSNIRHILMEFKIKNFSINGTKYTIIGTLDVNGLLIKNYKSYSNMTSFYALQAICKDVGLGFNSNISDSNDKMTWINQGLKVYDFFEDILDSSYISESSFPYGYIDFFYNFNYVDIAKELSRDNSQDKGIDTSGLSSNITGDDKRIYTLSLSNDKTIKQSDRFISEYKIINNSTSVSLTIGYTNTAKYYNSVQKESLVFTVDSITSPGDKSVILKGAPQDETFYKDNNTTTYTGKIDTDNSHPNFNYSPVHNSQNIEDLLKIGLKITLPNPNYNLYRFQRIKVNLTNDSQTPTSDLLNERISGDWFVVDIKIFMKDGVFSQEVSLIKRELELSASELNSESGVNDSKNTSPISTEKTVNPTDLSNTDVSSAPMLSNPISSTSSIVATSSVAGDQIVATASSSTTSISTTGSTASSATASSVSVSTKKVPSDYRGIVSQIYKIYHMDDSNNGYTSNARRLFLPFIIINAGVIKSIQITDREGMVNAIYQLLGLAPSDGSYYFNKMPLDKLSDGDKESFINQLNNLKTATLNKFTSFNFQYKNSDGTSGSYDIIPPDALNSSFIDDIYLN